MNKLAIIIIIIALLSLCIMPARAVSNENWSMTVNNNIIWIGERLEINITGEPSAWITIHLDSTTSNTSYQRDVITDENGSALLTFDDFYTEQAGNYLLRLHIENNVTPELIDNIDINYDDVLYLFIIKDRWEEYFGIDIDDYESTTGLTWQNERRHLQYRIYEADLKADKAFQMWIFSVIALTLPYMWLVWMFWDDIIKRWDKKRQQAMLPASRIRQAFTLKNPRVEHQGFEVKTTPPRNERGETKHIIEKRRRRAMKKHEITPEIIELTEKEEKGIWETIIPSWIWTPLPEQNKKDIREGKKTQKKEEKEARKKYKKDMKFIRENPDIFTPTGIKKKKKEKKLLRKRKKMPKEEKGDDGK